MDYTRAMKLIRQILTWLVALVIAAALIGIAKTVWDAAPVFHWLVFDLWVRHTVGILLLAALVTLWIWRLFAKGSNYDDPVLTFFFGGIAIVVIMVFYGVYGNALTDRILVQNIRPEKMETLPDTKQVRYLPIEITQRLAKNRYQSTSDLHLGDFDAFPSENGVDWITPRVPNGWWNSLTGQGNGFVIVRSDGTVDPAIELPMTYSEEAFFARSISWQLDKKNYFSEKTEVYYMRGGNEWLALSPYLVYDFYFPVMVPRWGGVLVLHSNGEIEDLTPQQAQSDKRFVDQRLYPEALAKRIAHGWATRGGILNAWFSHKDQVEIPKINDSENQMPYLLPTERGTAWFTAAEPVGGSFGIFKMFYQDVHSGVLSIYEPKQSLLGPNRILDYVRTAFPNYNWHVKEEGTVIVIEPRPLIRNSVLYWMATQTNTSYAEAIATITIDAQNEQDVRSFDNLSEVKEFIAGRFGGRTTAKQCTQVAGEENITQLSDADLFIRVRQTLDIIESRKN